MVPGRSPGDRRLASQRRDRHDSRGTSDSLVIRPEEVRSLWDLLQRNNSENSRGEQKQWP